MPASLTQYRVTRSVDAQNYKFVVFGACAFCCRLTAEEYVDEAAFEAFVDSLIEDGTDEILARLVAGGAEAA